MNMFLMCYYYVSTFLWTTSFTFDMSVFQIIANSHIYHVVGFVNNQTHSATLYSYPHVKTTNNSHLSASKIQIGSTSIRNYFIFRHPVILTWLLERIMFPIKLDLKGMSRVWTSDVPWYWAMKQWWVVIVSNIVK